MEKQRLLSVMKLMLKYCYRAYYYREQFQMSLKLENNKAVT